jgi:O-antigen/teichoic acid export membrane protein
VLSIIWAAKIFNRGDGQKFPNLTGILNYTFFTAVGLFAFTSLFSMDVIVVKGLFPAQEAGYYSAIATLGKIVLYLPSAAATLVLSKVAILNSTKQSTIQVLWKSLLVVGSLCAFTTVVFYLAPSFIVDFFFGSNYLEHYNLLGPYGLAMLFYSMSNIWLAYFLALREKIYSYALFAITIAQAIVLSTIASGLSQIIYFMIFFGILANVAGLLLLRRKEEKNGQAYV